MIDATIADVVSGRIEDGTEVELSGTAMFNQFHFTKQGNPWVEGFLIGPDTAVKVSLLPKQYSDFEGVLGICGDGRPPQVTVRGRVDKRGWQPAVIASEVVRLSAPHGPGLEYMRRATDQTFAAYKAEQAGGVS